MKYLKIPLQIQSAVNHRLSRCSYEESIAQQILLLITSHNGEVVGKEDYGSLIWELEFNQLVKISDWEEGVKNSLVHAINVYEKRLDNVKVDVILSEIEEDNKNRESHVRRQAQISVSGIIVKTNQEFHFSTLVYISPLSQ